MSLSLRTKLFLVILLGVLAPIELYMLYELGWQRHSLSGIFLQQGRALFHQIVITRRWLSRHGGIYVYKEPFVNPPPYLENTETSTITGDPITLLSPSLVTRELSELSAKEGLARFRMVSLTPINPANRPDAWEAKSLERFAGGAAEEWGFIGEGAETRFRYMAPLRTEISCLRCHVEYRYRVGEVRGGISVEFPVGKMIGEARRHVIQLAAAIGLLGVAIIGGLWWGTRRVLLNPLSQITASVSALSNGDYEYPLSPVTDGELGKLARTVLAMRAILKDYNQKLQEEVAHRTRQLEQMRAHAQREKEYLFNIFERMADGVCVISWPDHRVEYMNRSLTEIFGPAGAWTCYQVIRQAAQPCPDCPPLSSEEMSRMELQVPAAGRVFDVLHSELVNPDGSQSRLLVFRDITERKKLEEDLMELNRTLETKVREQTAALLEQEKLATLGEISSGMAHEIRNPLSAIMSGITLLESERRTPAERAHILKLLKKEANRLSSSLTDFLLFARPQEPKKVRIDLAGLIREIASLIQEDPYLSRETEIRLELEPLPPIWFDDAQLRQVIWNIALNALQAMEGKGTLTFRLKPHGEENFQMEIQDTGPGIPEQIKESIYDPFFSTKPDGTGLGLSIVRRIVLAHAGRISFVSTPGQGTTFIITAPRQKQDSAG